MAEITDVPQIRIHMAMPSGYSGGYAQKVSEAENGSAGSSEGFTNFPCSTRFTAGPS